VLVWTAGLASLAVFTPGVLALVNSLTRSGPVEWRLLLGPPVPTLIGACAATVVAGLSRAVGGGTLARYGTAAVAATAAAAVAFGLAGTPVWVSGVWQRPSWDVNPTQLANVRAFMASGPTNADPVLMPAGEMWVLAIFTTQVFAVLPRAYDLPGLQEPPAQTKARRLLLSLVTAGHKKLPIADVRRHALAGLDDLVDRGVKMLVIACNSASSACLRDARERYDVPVVEGDRPGRAPGRRCHPQRQGRSDRHRDERSRAVPMRKLSPRRRTSR